MKKTTPHITSTRRSARVASKIIQGIFETAPVLQSFRDEVDWEINPKTHAEREQAAERFEQQFSQLGWKLNTVRGARHAQNDDANFQRLAKDLCDRVTKDGTTQRDKAKNIITFIKYDRLVDTRAGDDVFRIDTQACESDVGTMKIMVEIGARPRIIKTKSLNQRKQQLSGSNNFTPYT